MSVTDLENVERPTVTCENNSTESLQGLVSGSAAKCTTAEPSLLLDSSKDAQRRSKRDKKDEDERPHVFPLGSGMCMHKQFLVGLETVKTRKRLIQVLNTKLNCFIRVDSSCLSVVQNRGMDDEMGMAVCVEKVSDDVCYVHVHQAVDMLTVPKHSRRLFSHFTDALHDELIGSLLLR